MGARFSCKSSETDVATRSTPRRTRVVHLDGSLVDYQDPTTVDQVLRNFPNHFLCTPVQIIQAGLVPLRLDHQLRSGKLYFMLPDSTLKFNASPVDLASLTKKLMNIAKTSRSNSAKSVPTSPSASPLCNPQPRSPSHSFGRGCGEDSMVKSLRWKPILDAITEG
ncbi:hypothetical protein Hdeb2414_s0024g00649261 [Helianthus debilis subsp. tardiflorus]